MRLKTDVVKGVYREDDVIVISLQKPKNACFAMDSSLFYS
jgi:hypothetical protein